MRQLRFLPLMLVFSLVFLLAKLTAFLNNASWLDNITISELYAATNNKAEPLDETTNPTLEAPQNRELSSTPSSIVEVVNPSQNPNKEGEVYKAEEYKGAIDIERIPNYSEQELELLKNLAQRRREIELVNKAMAGKQHILQVTESRIEEKLKEMNDLKAELSKMLDEYKTTNDNRLQNLVKIYETMKPKEAAQILEGLDMPILLQVLSRIKQMRAAPIIAQMNPQKAREITEMLATEQKLYSATCSCGEYPDINLFFDYNSK